MKDVVPEGHFQKANKVKEVIAVYREAEDLINIGAYAKGSNPKIDFAISVNDKVNNYLKQDIFERTSFEDTTKGLLSLF